MNTKFIKLLFKGLKKVENYKFWDLHIWDKRRSFLKQQGKEFMKKLKSPLEYNILIDNHCNIYR